MIGSTMSQNQHINDAEISNQLNPPDNVRLISLKTGVKPSPEFAKKQLATHSANIGLLCSHGCKYCSTAAMMRTQDFFKDLGMSSYQAFAQGIAVIDPNIHERMLASCKSLSSNDTVFFTTTTDAWAPEAQFYNVGRKVLKALLENSPAKIRILTKNSMVVRDYDLLWQYADRVELSLTITAPLRKAHIIEILEPNASPIIERIAALEFAHDMEIPVYGMLCPCIPGIIDSVRDFEDLLDTVLPYNPVNIWTEPINQRGDNILRCIEALNANNQSLAARALDHIRTKSNFKDYADKFIDIAIQAATNKNCLHLLKIMNYDKPHGPYANHPAVVWLR